MNIVLKIVAISYLVFSVVCLVCAVVSYFDFRFTGVGKKKGKSK